LTQNDRKKFLGNSQYAAPELVFENKNSTLVDSWSLGILTFELLVGRLPNFKKYGEFDYCLKNAENEVNFFFDFFCLGFEEFEFWVSRLFA
jgi:serine/threonine protein kinase